MATRSIEYLDRKPYAYYTLNGCDVRTLYESDPHRYRSLELHDKISAMLEDDFGQYICAYDLKNVEQRAQAWMIEHILRTGIVPFAVELEHLGIPYEPLVNVYVQEGSFTHRGLTDPDGTQYQFMVNQAQTEVLPLAPSGPGKLLEKGVIYTGKDLGLPGLVQARAGESVTLVLSGRF